MLQRMTGNRAAGKELLARAMAVASQVRGLRAVEPVDWTGKVALVTGGSRGLGFLLARELLGQGCKVAICARDGEELERARRQLEAEGEIATFTCDISDRAAVQRLAADVLRRFGGLDILVNNAGIIEVGPLSAMTIEDFEAAMGVMFWGMLYCTLAVLPGMKQRREGWIVNITSIGGKISAPHLLPYSSAKFAAVGLSEGLHAELAGDGVHVTTVVPGLMRTGSQINALFKGIRRSEYTWFALAATLPGISLPAEQAARDIVAAARRGQAEITLGLPAVVGARFQGLFPGFTANLSGLVDRVMPPDTPPNRAERGAAEDRRLNSAIFDLLTSLGRQAARRFNERAP